MHQEFIIGLLLLVIAFALMIPAIRLKKINRHSFSLWIRIVIVILWGIGLSLIAIPTYVPESYPVRIFVFISLFLGWIGFTIYVIITVYKLLDKGWKKILFLVPILFITVTWSCCCCIYLFSELKGNIFISNEVFNKFTSGPNTDKALYLVPNSGGWFSKPGFSFYYRPGKLPLMEYKTGYHATKIEKITRNGDTIFCDLVSTRFFTRPDIRLVFNLKTGKYSEE